MNRVVAFIDVLGFRKMIEIQSATQLGEQYKEAVRFGLGKYRIKGDFSDVPAFFPEIDERDNYCISHVFSDSIILTSFDETEESCLKLLVFTYMLTRGMIALGFPVRGGVSYGDMFIDLQDSIFVGRALTET